MPFDQTFSNPSLTGESLNLELRDERGQVTAANLNLNTILGNVDGKLKWGGRDLMSTAQDLSLNGSILSAKLKHGDDILSDQIDLSFYIKNNNGKLETVYGSVNAARNPSTDAVSDGNRNHTAMDPPPAYHNSKSAAYRSYRTASNWSQESRSSTYFVYTVAADNLRLEGSVLQAECLKLDGTYVSQTLELDDHIGVVNGQLVWGRSKFHSICQNIRLVGYILHADYRDENDNTISSSLDLSRYLQCYDGVLGVKMTVNDAELTSFLREARWLKLRVIAESDASAVVGKNPAFKGAFNSIAVSTSEHVLAEMNELFAESSRDDKKGLVDKAKADMNRVVATSIPEGKKLSERIEAVFETAKREVIEICNDMIAASVNDLNNSFASILGPLADHFVGQDNGSEIMDAVREAISATIAHYQERAEILMEREMMAAATRGALHKELVFGEVWD
ncbi:hypothetical protein D9758_018643 [Tetrapyrgos nigripes]|uniref:Cyanovirin-N domain-containing protein n=1 Tax=Tetrapyrgos nigripes TaxID=182062 RepID=A0A8H5FAP8_9AGAR|nr:hypothetical protein D9758_018643 [Tetrapyrgos nigripes]